MIITGIFVLFFVTITLSIHTNKRVKELAIGKTESVMFEDQKKRIQLATFAMAQSLGSMLGQMTGNVDKETMIRKEVQEIIYEPDHSGYFFVYRDTTNVAFPVAPDKIGIDLGQLKDKNGTYVIQELLKKSKAGGGFVHYIWPKPGSGDTPKLSYAMMIPGTNYWIGTGVYLDNIDRYTATMSKEISTHSNHLTTRMIVICSVILVGIALLCIAILSGICKALSALIESVRDIAEGEGDLTKRIAINSKDELGVLGGWVNLFLEKLQGIIKNLAHESNEVDRASRRLSAIAETMAKGSENTLIKANKVTTATEEMTGKFTNVASAMEASSENTHLAASASEEMAATINEIADTSEKANHTAQSAAETIQRVGANILQLKGAANAIGKITETINKISEQTNLLALNATIEAARAGEAGKGFAVVANEIKTLAEQTSEATSSIQNHINRVQDETDATQLAVAEGIKVVDEVKEQVNTIAAAITEQTAATQEISSSLEQLSLGIQEVNEDVNQSAAAAGTISRDIADVSNESETMRESSSRVERYSGELQAMSSQLNQIVRRFIVD